MKLVHLIEDTDFVHAIEQDKIKMTVCKAELTIEEIKKCQELGIREIQKYSQYNIGEIVGVAASYCDSGYSMEWCMDNLEPTEPLSSTMSIEASYPGWSNSYCVVPQAMNNMIVIDNIRLCRFSEITVDEFKKMGVYQEKFFEPENHLSGYLYKMYGVNYKTDKIYDAIWRLMTELFGLDDTNLSYMQQNDPYMFVYKFHLLDDDKTENIYQSWLQSTIENKGNYIY